MPPKAAPKKKPSPGKDHSGQKLHSKRSPSGLKSLQVCCGFINDESGDKSAGREGDMLHYFVLESGMDEADTLKKFPDVPMTQERRDWAEAANNYIQHLIDIAGDGSDIKVEEWLDLSSLEIKDCNGGTADLLIIKAGGKEAHLLDLKFGWIPVDEVESNIQFRTYAIGAFLNYPKLQKIHIHMVQPKLDAVDECDVNKDEVELIESTMRAIVSRVDRFEETQDASMLNADETNCNYCARQPTCPLWVGAAIETAKVGAKFGIPDSDKEFDVTLIPKGFTGWDASEADPIQVAMMMKVLGPMESFIRRYKRFALEVHQNAELPGFREQSSSGKSSLISILDARDILVKKFKLTPDEFQSICTVSIDGIKTLVGSRAPTGKKGLLAEEAIEALSDAGLIDQAPSYSFLKSTGKRKKSED